MEETGMKRKGNYLCDLQCKRVKLESEENSDFINYISEPPSLQSIAMISIATKICTRPDMKHELEDTSKGLFYEAENVVFESSYESLEEKVLEKLSEMGLPCSLNIGVSNVIRPVLLQLLKCFCCPDEENHEIYNIVYDIGSICWTMHGTIDRARLFTDVINDGAVFIGIKYVYYYACRYCIEEIISKLWVKLSDMEDNVLYRLLHKYQYHIVAYWTAVMKNELPDLMTKIKRYDLYNIYDLNASINQNMVSLAVHSGNSLALKYFWYKLTEQEKKLNVKRWFVAVIEKTTYFRNSFLYMEYNERTDVICFLLSHLNGPDEQKEIFQSYSMIILKSLFFSWPFQKWFLPTATMMLDYLDEFSYVKIMSDIFNAIKVGRTAHELFRELWSISPIRLKRKLLHIFPSFWCIHRPIWRFLSVGDVKTLLIILDDASLEQKKRVIFDVAKDRKVLFDILFENKLDLLDTLISKTLPIDEVDYFKQQVNLKHVSFLFHCLTCKGAFPVAEQFLNWIIPSKKEIMIFKKSALNPVTLYYHLINWGDYTNFNLFMKWYFEKKYKIDKFKRAIVHKINSPYERELLLSKLCGGGSNAWDKFENFFNWSTDKLFTPRQISQLKKLFLKGIASIVAMRNFDFATKLLNWCIDSAEMVSRFKSELLLSPRQINLLVYEIYCKYPNWERMENLFIWFGPLSTDVISELKSLLNETKPFKKNKLRAFYRFLDNFIENPCTRMHIFDEYESTMGFNFWEYDFIDDEDDRRDYDL